MAELTDARRDALMAYCRIDELASGEDALLEEMYLDAVSYLAQSGVAEPPAGTPRKSQYDLLVGAMVLDAWDSRGCTATNTAILENPSFRRKLNQMKLTEPVPDSGTGIGRSEG